MIVRLTQLDGKLPNLALMRLSAFHRARGDELHYHRSATRGLFEPEYDVVYGSAIFDFTAEKVARFKSEFPDATLGGTWNHKPGTPYTGPKVEDIIGNFDGADYSFWPTFQPSLGFTQRGCRFNCSFCGVPTKEGKPVPVASIADLWRGEPWPRQLHLLDNDFFGQPKAVWRARLAEIRDGGFEVCFNQGINVRVITDEIAAELATVKYRDDSFRFKRIYTAWDTLGDEALFFRGVDRLERAGISPTSLMAYMLIGEAPDETWAAVFHRFNRMVERGVRPYPMVFGDRHRNLPLGGHNEDVGHQRLMDFQRWVLTGLYRRAKKFGFAEYDVSARAPRDLGPSMFGEAA